ncbi:MAG: lamin tail domain-containing protein [Patescibacteria group bacterium]|jgi:predicted ribosomally synthesized peptide with SipW-like signal peptide
MLKIIKSAFIISAVMCLASFATNAVFTDQVEVSDNTFQTGTWETPSPDRVVINEVYYDVDALHGDEGKNEWIELYNPNDVEINIKGWSISDNYYTKTINPDVSIPAHGFVLLSHDNNTWQLWGNPSGDNIVTINLGGNTDWLSNAGDRIILNNPSGTTVDQMNYGTDTAVWNPACPDVTAGHSLSRSSLGFDSDLASDFIDLTTPTPGA